MITIAKYRASSLRALIECVAEPCALCGAGIHGAAFFGDPTPKARFHTAHYVVVCSMCNFTEEWSETIPVDIDGLIDENDL